ncbi:hypothetical protein BD410DRAFT_810644, partial [Rickenella mellea]
MKILHFLWSFLVLPQICTAYKTSRANHQLQTDLYIEAASESSQLVCMTRDVQVDCVYCGQRHSARQEARHRKRQAPPHITGSDAYRRQVSRTTTERTQEYRHNEVPRSREPSTEMTLEGDGADLDGFDAMDVTGSSEGHDDRDSVERSANPEEHEFEERNHERLVDTLAGLRRASNLRDHRRTTVDSDSEDSEDDGKD